MEDDADLRDTVVTALTQFGYRALAAPNAERALNILSGSEHIDLLFTDVMMPGGTLGPELAHDRADRGDEGREAGLERRHPEAELQHQRHEEGERPDADAEEGRAEHGRGEEGPLEQLGVE